ncbi:hypothetical protein KSP40_PGU013689 [Platanthera guangdongensis]|uniref:Uncharacterized protein n=1 Tax=Platanthera guangdongensis TaxID=2320717 RepID=A0ABR2LRA6_9ASPA
MSASAAGALVGSSPSAHLFHCLHSPRLRFDLRHSRRRGISSKITLRSVREQRAAATVAPREEDKDVVLVNGYGLNGSGSLPGFEALETSGNGNFDAYMNGRNGVENLSLVKYPGRTDEAVQELHDESAERKRRTRVEDIGKEDAWFKNSQENQYALLDGGGAFVGRMSSLIGCSITFAGEKGGRK